MERQRTTLIICVGPNSEVVWFYSVVAQFLLLGHLKNLDLKTSENARSSHRAFRVFISKKKKNGHDNSEDERNWSAETKTAKLTIKL